MVLGMVTMLAVGLAGAIVEDRASVHRLAMSNAAWRKMNDDYRREQDAIAAIALAEQEAMIPAPSDRIWWKPRTWGAS
jgi:Flp pilus assembly protein TadD